MNEEFTDELPWEEVKGIKNLSLKTDDDLAERRHEIKGEISALEKQISALKEERESIDEEFMARFQERGSSSTKTSRFTTSIRRDVAYPVLADQTAFEEFVLNKGALHLLQKRISLSAINEELAIMEQDRQAYLDMLEVNEGSREVCYDILRQLNKLTAKEVITFPDEELKEYTKSVIDSAFTIPGIELITKETINQVKRG